MRTNERAPLLRPLHRDSITAPPDDASSFVESHLSKEEQAVGHSAVGERLPYNDYTTIDWMHDLVCSISHE